jgi:hypothetical protein
MPPSPEQLAAIATALADAEEGTHYATAGEWLDALARYIGILNDEMRWPTDGSVAQLNKYAQPLLGGDDASLAAYVQVRLDALGG